MAALPARPVSRHGVLYGDEEKAVLEEVATLDTESAASTERRCGAITEGGS